MVKAKKVNKRLVILLMIIVVLVVAIIASRGFMQVSIEDLEYNELISRFDSYFLIPKGYEDSFVSAQIKYPVSSKTGGGGEYNHFTVKDEYAVKYMLELKINSVNMTITANKIDPNFQIPTQPTPPDEIIAEMKKITLEYNGHEYVCDVNGFYEHISYSFNFNDVNYSIKMETIEEKYFDDFVKILSDMSRTN